MKRFALIAVLLGAAACAKKDTRIIVAVDSDYAIPAELDHLTVVARADDGTTASAHDFLLPGEVGLPFSFVVEHDGSSSLELRVDFTPKRESTPLYTRRAIVHFVEGKSLLLPIFLAKMCATVSCAVDQSCSERGCISDDVGELMEIDPGDETKLDAGVHPNDDGGIVEDGGEDFPDANPNLAGFVVDPAGGLETGEDGTFAIFTVKLDRVPESYVVIPVSTSDPNEGTADTNMLTFTPLDWDQPKAITVRGVDDGVKDGDRGYTIVLAPATSPDVRFEGADPADVAVTNVDDDVPAIRLFGATGLSTTEAGGEARFSIGLASEPAMDVVLDITSDTIGEGIVATPSFTITPAQWTDHFEIVVRGADDMAADGPKAFGVRINPMRSPDPDYAALTPVTVIVTNADNETAGITSSPSSGLTTSESGGSASFTVVLNTQPGSDVTIDFTASKAGEVIITPPRVTFASANWDQARTVLITGDDDRVDDGDQALEIEGAISTADSAYAAVAFMPVGVTNTDDDTAGVQIVGGTGLVTNEGGQTAQFGVVLTAEPTAQVTIPIASSTPSEGTADVTMLVFAQDDWDLVQTVTVTGADDSAQDGDAMYFIQLGATISTDPAFALIDPPDVTLVNSDNDAAGITVAPRMLDTFEGGAMAPTFTVQLNTRPTADVTVTLATSDSSEVTVSPAMLTFTNANWMTPQIAFITGVDDAIDDGDVSVTILAGAATSADPAYNGIDPPDVAVLNHDNDTASINVAPASGLNVQERGTTATFTVVLGSQPSANITIALSSSDTTEGTVAPSSLTFNTADWNMARTVTITGVEDGYDDGDVAFTIVTGAATSADPSYSGRNPPNVAVTNQDDDTAGILVSLGPPIDVTESNLSGSGRSFSIVLLAQPTANVSIALSAPADEAAVNPPSVTFTTMNWAVPQAVLVNGVDDGTLDGDQTYVVTTAAATSGDPAYSGMNADDVDARTIDDGALPQTALTNGMASTGPSERPAISADGMYVVFQSADANLVPGDTNNATDVFLFDRHTLATTRISMAGMTQANGDSTEPQISADGGFIVFTSAASNLAGSDTNSGRDVFLYERASGAITLVSIASNGSVRTFEAYEPAISADGLHVAFVSGDGAVGHCMFVYDVQNPAAGSVYVGMGQNCHQPSLTADGQLIVYAIGFGGQFLRLVDRSNGTQGDPANGHFAEASAPRITPDGRYLVLNGVENTGTDSLAQAYLMDRLPMAGAFELVSVASSGLGTADAGAFAPDISNDGSFVTFRSSATNLGFPQLIDGLYVRTRPMASTAQLVGSVIDAPRISGDGRFLTYAVGASSGSVGATIYLSSR